MILTVDKEDAENHLALICDFAKMLRITEDEFEDIAKEGVPLCDQIEDFAKSQSIPLGKGWKVQLATTVKQEILRGRGKVIDENDKEFMKVEELFRRILS